MPSISPTTTISEAIGGGVLRRRKRGLEDPELLALLAPLHVGGDTGLEAFVAELLVALEEVLVLALQRDELLGDPRRPVQIGVDLGDLGVQPLDVLARGDGAQMGALLLCTGILLRGRQARIFPSPALSIVSFSSAISCRVATMSGCFSVKPRPRYSASC